MTSRNGESAGRRRLLQSQLKAPVPLDQTRRRPTTERDRGRACGVHEVETLVAPAPADDRSGEAGGLGRRGGRSWRCITMGTRSGSRCEWTCARGEEEVMLWRASL